MNGLNIEEPQALGSEEFGEIEINLDRQEEPDAILIDTTNKKSGLRNGAADEVHEEAAKEPAYEPKAVLIEPRVQ